MVNSREIRQLRQELLRKQSRVGRKIARLKRVNDVAIAGTELDPRRNRDLIKRYNAAQLRAYDRQLSSFLSRRTQFYSGARGTIISREARLSYEREQRKVNRYRQQRFQKIADIVLPSGQTIGERVTILPLRMRSNMAANRPFENLTASYRGLVGDRGARIQAAELSKKHSDEYYARMSLSNRDAFNKMVDAIGDTELARLVDSMSREQFDVLWQYTAFANAISITYGNLTSDLIEDPRQAADLSSNEMSQAHELAAWASSLDIRR